MTIRTKRARHPLLVLVGAGAVALGSIGRPATADFAIDSHTFATGGRSTGGSWTMHATIGQPDAGQAAGGDFGLAGGYIPASGIPSSPPCPGDVDGNDDVGFTDLLAVLSAWGPCPNCPEDLDGSGDVGFTDLLTVLQGWGACP